MFWKKKKNADKDSGKPADAAADAPTVDAPDAPPTVPVTPAPETDVTEPDAAKPDTSDTSPELAQAPAETSRRGWRQRLSGSGFARGLSSLFTRHPKLDDALLDELETVLITADLGVNASMELVEDLRERMHKREFADADALLGALRQALVTQLDGIEQPLNIATA